MYLSFHPLHGIIIFQLAIFFFSFFIIFSKAVAMNGWMSEWVVVVVHCNSLKGWTGSSFPWIIDPLTQGGALWIPDTTYRLTFLLIFFIKYTTFSVIPPSPPPPLSQFQPFNKCLDYNSLNQVNFILYSFIHSFICFSFHISQFPSVPC